MRFIHKHIEWSVFLLGLLLLGSMDVSNSNHSLCFFEWVGFKYCLGEGLGHSIAYFFQGDFKSSFQANIMGPFAVLVLSFRIVSIWIKLYTLHKQNKLGTNYV